MVMVSLPFGLIASSFTVIKPIESDRNTQTVAMNICP